MNKACLVQIRHEETMEVKQPLPQTVDRLREIMDVSCQNGRNGEQVVVECSKKGDILARCFVPVPGTRSDRRYSPHCVCGKVLSENQKTVIKLYTAYSRCWLYYRVMATLIILSACFLTITALWLSGILSQNYPTEGKILFIALVILIFLPFEVRCLLVTQKLDTDNTDFLKDEVKRRIEAVKHWDD